MAKSGMSRRSLFKTSLAVSAVGAAGVAFTARVAEGAPNPGPKADPTIHGCDDWGARQPTGTILVENHKPTYIVVHHTAGANSDDLSKDHAFAISRDIQNFHMDTRGWIDTGQQLTNSRGGHITEGRHRSLEVLRGGTKHVQGANVGNHNSEVIGIENEGLYTNVDVTPQLWDSLVALVSYIARQYGIAPEQIKGHRDFNSTECPGETLYARLPELRDAVGGRLGVPVTQPPTWPLLKVGSAGTKVLAAQHLLRAAGVRDVPVDGVFSDSTFRAVQGFTREHGVTFDPCYASRVADESGLLGAGGWPLITPTLHPGNQGDAVRAAQLLLSDGRISPAGVADQSTVDGVRAAQSANGLPATGVIDARTWQALLAR
ncbi:peptidoglycan hydrolase-like protein with peptidoglycan-binding domain [Herbihabitans rhizosphaerae]|uniref:Peptidoglycan hydrolase-like protein with peptidoglycan-binding domain n=2 Tax=Herbihabitans rhizosphaerae TaxID=1872711 RepID=A0A4Q7KVV7_9PSEU|nr:peptidoglycan hydrolase-like protein with peptidoglycan-binding domain [Herbihabitans rhizosphaerae]